MSGSVAVHRGSLGFPAMGGGEERRKRGGDDEEEEEEEEEENGVRGMEAWERAYADERSWEALQEDESGLLRPIDTKTLVHAQYRRRLLLRSAAASSAAPRIQKGLIRYLYVVIDLSRAASEMDFRPSRMVVVAKCVENALELVYGYLSQIPSYGHREVLILYSALNTCDPGDIMETVQQCKKAKIRCSVIGLSAEIYICKHLCEETGGSYTVALDESHFKELLLEHAPPPPAIAEYAAANLIRMGFPQRGADGVISICSCHKEAKVGGGYTCPRCKARVCELPTECQICGLTLVSSPHLARSYHHLFPVTPFNEVSSRIPTKWSQKLPQTCYGCQQSLVSHGGKSDPHVSCPKCNQHFCLDCDIYIHESLHNCPGCESQHGSTT
ncbi:general transcription factor IIH subunit 2-like isoform X2 [Phoenix dactylifera]|uniref:General transcription factor IIH subunit n=1 Tax=Phoenix dactylifera TaxID=42345 RepID=A0A8B9A7C6_PHODC|nr:general transcription factor IIH subunit 2-like isoform X2 [Phoenix dactylifera]